MDQLKQAWVYRFWIAIGLVVLLPIIGYIVNTQSLARTVQARKNKIEGQKKNLEGLKSGPNPNDQWVDSARKLKDALSQQVDVAWNDLYDRQYLFMRWPEQVQDVFLSARAEGKDEKVPPETLVEYQELFPNQFREIVTRVQPVGLPNSQGLVELDPDVVFKFTPAWTEEGADPPTVMEAWQAQEDVWLLRALLDVVKNANKKSTKFQESSVKRLLDIDIGEKAYDLTLTGKGGRQSGGADAKAAGAASKGAAGKGRYVGQENKLFRQIPVTMELVVDQMKLVDVLTEFANSGIPMQITQVEFSQASERPPSSVRASSKQAEATGTAPLKEDEYFHMTRLKVWARAFLYEKPDAPRPPAQAADQTPTPGKA